MTEVEKRYLALGGEKSWLGKPLIDVISLPDGEGLAQEYENASIHWHPNTGAFITLGAIRSTWKRLNWENGILGYPITDEHDISVSQFYNTYDIVDDGVVDNTIFGRRSIFERGSIVWSLANTIFIFNQYNERVFLPSESEPDGLWLDIEVQGENKITIIRHQGYEAQEVDEQLSETEVRVEYDTQIEQYDTYGKMIFSEIGDSLNRFLLGAFNGKKGAPKTTIVARQVNPRVYKKKIKNVESPIQLVDVELQALTDSFFDLSTEGKNAKLYTHNKYVYELHLQRKIQLLQELFECESLQKIPFPLEVEIVRSIADERIYKKWFLERGYEIPSVKVAIKKFRKVWKFGMQSAVQCVIDQHARRPGEERIKICEEFLDDYIIEEQPQCSISELWELVKEKSETISGRKIPYEKLALLYLQYVAETGDIRPPQDKIATHTKISQATWSRAYNELLFWKELNKKNENVLSAYPQVREKLEIYGSKTRANKEKSTELLSYSEQRVWASEDEDLEEFVEKTISPFEMARIESLPKQQLIREIQKYSTVTTEAELNARSESSLRGNLIAYIRFLA